MLFIGKGTDPNLNNDVTIAFDKKILEGLDRDRPPGGYPPAQEKGIKELRDRVDAYEALNGEVDVNAVEDAQEREMAAGLALLSSVVAGMHGTVKSVTVAPPAPPRHKGVHTPPPAAPASAPAVALDNSVVHAIRLAEGDGDVYFKLVNATTYNWIMNGGKFPKNQITAIVESSRSLTEAQDTMLHIDKFMPDMDEQDRAGNVVPDRFGGEALSGYGVSTNDIIRFCAKHGLTLSDDEFEGLAL